MNTLEPLKQKIIDAYQVDEEIAVHALLDEAFSDTTVENIQARAKGWIEHVRDTRTRRGGIDAFLMQYDLSSQEGIVLMCLAEALLRIPDAATRDLLIRDKIGAADWISHVGQSDSLFVNAATYGLLLTGKLLHNKETSSNSLFEVFRKMAAKSSEPIIRRSIVQAMKILGEQFVMGQTIDKAMKRAQKHERVGYRYSYDMLGESAKTQRDADVYFESYANAIESIAKKRTTIGCIEGPGISVKLSALHPRYEDQKRELVFQSLYPRLLELALLAKKHDMSFTIDAEESNRLLISLELFEALLREPKLHHWHGLSLAVQAYQKRAVHVIDWLVAVCRDTQRRIMVRLVKGAYWDSEIKRAQELGLESYPVFTRKISTDASYLVCAKRLLAATDVIYPMFATHNAYTAAAIVELSGHQKAFEFQCLHGMGDSLYDQIVNTGLKIPCRVYAPVGGHNDLLAYLVRRLLENGANTSFVNRILDEQSPVEQLLEDPFEILCRLPQKAHPQIPLPKNLYGDYRENSLGIDFSDPKARSVLFPKLKAALEKPYQARSTVTHHDETETRTVIDPSDNRRILGEVTLATPETVKLTLERATTAFQKWRKVDVKTRADLLRKTAQLLERDKTTLMALLVREGGKTLPDAVSEVREAIDFCYYYANRAEIDFKVEPLPGPTGEENSLGLYPRGVIFCISPWNFPLAIFLGQVTAALAAGNCVIAKPAAQTPLVAHMAIALLHEAGFPTDVVLYITGSASMIGGILLPSDNINGVMFTGSTATGQLINRTLASRQGSIVPLIAETGGQNAMIVDSSALPEQVVHDVAASAFNSAGQRCSALRVLFLQEEIADKVIEMLKGYMQTLEMGDPMDLTTDVGPVIDEQQLQFLIDHLARMKKEANVLAQVPFKATPEKSHFFAPHLIEIQGIHQLKEEVFGPVLHVVRFKQSDLLKVVESVNATGFGLTLGIHSRIQSTIQMIVEHANVGNVYVNRNMIGAVVGVQPFGGENLSGTGPKAGGPHYLPRLAVERTLSVNTTAAGGNATLMTLSL